MVGIDLIKEYFHDTSMPVLMQLFEHDGLAARGGDVEVEARVAEVEHRQEHLHRVVARMERLAVLHPHVALVGADHEDGLAARVLVGVRLFHVLGLAAGTPGSGSGLGLGRVRRHSKDTCVG